MNFTAVVMLVTRIFAYFVTFSVLCILTLILKYWKLQQKSTQRRPHLFEAAESNPVWKVKLSPFSSMSGKVSRRGDKRAKLNQTFPSCQFQLAETLPISVFGKKNAEDNPKNIPMHQVCFMGHF